MDQKTKNILYPVSAILILAAALGYFSFPAVAGYVMIVGVLGVAIVTFTSPYPGESLRGKRLFNIQVFAVLLMAISASLMFLMISQWVVSLLLAGILTLYCSILLPKELEKEEKNKKS